MARSTIVITAADAGYFEFLRGTIRSIRDKAPGREVALAVLDLGCTPEQRDWLRQRVDRIAKAEWEFTFPARDRTAAHFKALLVRPFLRKYFPGFDLYFWIDADAWVQDWSAVELFLRGAERRGLAIVPEIDRGSQLLYGGLPGYWDWAFQYYETSFGKEVAWQLRSYPMLNAGVYALHRDAPHWQAWAECLHTALQNAATVYMTDQAALNLLVYTRGLFDRTELLPAWCNWTCHYGLPAWDRSSRRLVEPYLPHTPIGILHMTGPKEQRHTLATTDGGTVELSLRYAGDEAAPPSAPPPHPFGNGDYVAPELAIVEADRFFPNLIVGDKSKSAWPFLRRQIPHNWYVDRRFPTIGFLSRDEAHLLYNLAREFQGKRALEIGCWLGWSTCHLALGGVQLDVVDPVLGRSDFHESVSNSLRAAGVQDRVHLVAGPSPLKVEELSGNGQRRWSLFFIDGDHEVPAPLYDAAICAECAEADAAIVFHDLAAPDVAQGLDYLRQHGWRTQLYQTMQIMGIAWRGNVNPVRHRPDPRVAWSLPAHLRGYPISQ